jgi:LysR family transcriptional regulator, hydrogen peroxide-inducible genes activator
MTLTQLSYAVAVDTFRHFGRAAEHCHVSQPTLSMQLRKLEEELGVTLFDRSRQPVEPTEVGAEVIAQARLALQEADRVRELADAVHGAVRGELRLGILPTIAPYLLPLISRPFEDAVPEASLLVRELRTDEAVEEVRRGRLDAAIIATEERQPGITERPLFREPFVAYLAADHPLAGHAPLAPEDIPPADLWLLSEGHCFRDQVLRACGQRQPGSGPLRFESGTLDTLQKMVDYRGGATLLPLLATRYMDAARLAAHVRHFRQPGPAREVRLVAGRSGAGRRLVDALVRVIEEAVPGALSGGG